MLKIWERTISYTTSSEPIKNWCPFLIPLSLEGGRDVARTSTTAALMYGLVVQKFIPHQLQTSIIDHYRVSSLFTRSKVGLNWWTLGPFPIEKRLWSSSHKSFTFSIYAMVGLKDGSTVLNDPVNQHWIHPPPIFHLGRILCWFLQRPINKSELFLCLEWIVHRSCPLFIFLPFQFNQRDHRSAIFWRVVIHIKPTYELSKVHGIA